MSVLLYYPNVTLFCLSSLNNYILFSSSLRQWSKYTAVWVSFKPWNNLSQPLLNNHKVVVILKFQTLFFLFISACTIFEPTLCGGYFLSFSWATSTSSTSSPWRTWTATKASICRWGRGRGDALKRRITQVSSQQTSFQIWGTPLVFECKPLDGNLDQNLNAAC